MFSQHMVRKTFVAYFSQYWLAKKRPNNIIFQLTLFWINTVKTHTHTHKHPLGNLTWHWEYLLINMESTNVGCLFACHFTSCGTAKPMPFECATSKNTPRHQQKLSWGFKLFLTEKNGSRAKKKHLQLKFDKWPGDKQLPCFKEEDPDVHALFQNKQGAPFLIKPCFFSNVWLVLKESNCDRLKLKTAIINYCTYRYSSA